MRRTLATILTLALIAMFLWTASPVYAGEAHVKGDCDNWYVNIRTLGSTPELWSVTLDGQPVTDGTHIIPDTVNVTRTFTVVWTKGGKVDTKLFTGERTLNCGTTTTQPPVTTSTAPTTTVSSTATTSIPVSTTTPITTTSSVPVTLPFTGINPVQTGGLGIGLLILGALAAVAADSRRDDE